jgi:hypothetical protein
MNKCVMCEKLKQELQQAKEALQLLVNDVISYDHENDVNIADEVTVFKVKEVLPDNFSYRDKEKAFKIVKGNCDEGCERAIWENSICILKDECNLPLGLMFEEIEL